jgi:hypothetical protein
MLPSRAMQVAKEFADNPDNAMSVVVIGFLACVILAVIITAIEFGVRRILARGEGP